MKRVVFALIACVLMGANASASRAVEMIVVVAAEYESPVWHDVPDNPALQFAVEWNAQFRSHDIMWRNRSNRPLRFQFSADSIGATENVVHPRVLAAGASESMPGESVSPSKSSRAVQVCLISASEKLSACQNGKRNFHCATCVFTNMHTRDSR